MPEATPTPLPMEDVLSEAGNLFTWVMSSLGSVVSTIIENPILLLGFIIGLVGLVIGFTRRLMNLS